MSRNTLGEFSGSTRFEIRRRVGAGGMGVVYEAFDRERGMSVALKTIQNLDPSTLYRFKHEFRALADITHPNLVRLHELFSDGDEWFFTMELVEGEEWLRYVCPSDAVPNEEPSSASSIASLAEDLGLTLIVTNPHASESSLRTIADGTEPVRLPRTERQNPTPESTLDVDKPISSARASQETRIFRPTPSPQITLFHDARLRQTLRQLVEALDALHGQGKLHRDIKPSNVLVGRRGRLVLLDFGLSTEMEGQGDRQTTDGCIVGTVSYMAPEQAGGRPLSPASDWYSVGVMLYRALTGKLPFVGKSLEVLMDKQREDPAPPSTIAEGVPSDLNDLCVDLLSRRPDDRPTGTEILQRLGLSTNGTGVGGEGRSTLQSRPFVGRESQLASLGEALALARQGKTVKAFVHGRSGAGKSALTQRFLEGLLENAEAVVLAGRCYEQESVAYKALDTLIDSLSRYLRRLKRSDAEAILPRDVHALARVFPVLRRVEAVADAPLRGFEIPDQQELRRRAFAALRELLARIGDRRPLVLYIDDLQWGDLDSAALLGDLLRPPDPPSLLLICSYRSEYAGVSPCLRRLLEPADKAGADPNRREINVDALTTDEARSLALAMIGADDEPARFIADLIVRESGGIPFFVVELVQYLQQMGSQSNEGIGSLTSISLDEVLWNRISRLADDPRILLEALAVAGQPIRQSLACRSVGLGSEGYEALAVLRAGHMIRSTGAGSLDHVETYHDRVRETVIRHLEPETLKARHLGLGRELEAIGDADPETLAVHFEGGGESAKAGRYYAVAAAQAADALAFERAAKLYQFALDLTPASAEESRAVRIKLANALANAGRGLDAAGIYREAAVGASEAEVRRLHQLAGYQYLATGHVDEGLAILRDVLVSMGLDLPRTPKQALLGLLKNRFLLRLRGRGYRERQASEISPQELSRVDIARSISVGLTVVDWIRGSSFTSRTLLLALRAGEPLRVCLSLAWEAVPSACEGRVARKRTAHLIASADALAKRLADPHAIGMTEMARGASEFLLGRFNSCVEISDRAVEILRDQCTGVIWEMDTAQLFALWALTYAGHLSELRKRCPRIVKEARDRGDRYLESTVAVFPAVLERLADDDPDEARAHMEEAIGRWSQSGFHVQHLTCFYGAMDLDLYDGNAAGAWQRAVETWPRFEASELPRIQLVKIYFMQQSGRAALALAAESSDPGPLIAAAEVYARRLRKEKLDWSEALSVVLHACIANRRGDVTTAAKLLADAIARCDAVALDLFAASARRQLGKLLGGDEGRALIERADAWMTAQTIRRPEKMADAMIPGFAGR
jgi:serine/threonine protein kinase/tetratricopeptide (TPR) repeat protein